MAKVDAINFKLFYDGELSREETINRVLNNYSKEDLNDYFVSWLNDLPETPDVSYISSKSYYSATIDLDNLEWALGGEDELGELNDHSPEDYEWIVNQYKKIILN